MDHNGDMVQRTNRRIDYGDGKYYEGEMRNGLLDGKGTYRFDRGVYIGEFCNNKYHGVGKVIYDLNNEHIFDNKDYDLSEQCVGSWNEGKQNGRFIRYIDGIPYDEEYKDGKKIFSKIYFDLPVGENLSDSSKLKCCYGGQSSFIVETQRETLVFDWYRASMPPLNPNKPVYIFISNVNDDHFHSRILYLKNNYSVSEIYIGYDRSNPKIAGKLDKVPPDIDEIISCFNEEQFLLTDFGSVKSLHSTGPGVAFLVNTKYATIFHAGDLFCRSKISYNEYKMNIENNLPAELKERLNIEEMAQDFHNRISSNEKDFEKFTELLRNVGPIDYAMLPMDPRWSDYGFRTVNHYLEIADIKMFSPMHLCEKWDFVSDYVKAYPNVAEKMIAINPDKLDIRQSIELNTPYFIQSEKIYVKELSKNEEINISAKNEKLYEKIVEKADHQIDVRSINSSINLENREQAAERKEKVNVEIDNEIRGCLSKKELKDDDKHDEERVQEESSEAELVLMPKNIQPDAQKGSEEKAIKLQKLKLSAEQGDAKAQYDMGFTYEKGEEVYENFKESFKWYKLAADQGFVKAMFKVGVMYFIGLGDPLYYFEETNYKEALKWYKLAADQGDSEAQQAIGSMYECGNGVAQDYAEALKWYKLAADKGYAYAQWNVGRLYEKGQGVTQDNEEALKWYKLAAIQGHEISKVKANEQGKIIAYKRQALYNELIDTFKLILKDKKTLEKSVDITGYQIDIKKIKGIEIGQNVPCPCGSGKEYKDCCGIDFFKSRKH